MTFAVVVVVVVKIFYESNEIILKENKTFDFLNMYMDLNDGNNK